MPCFMLAYIYYLYIYVYEVLDKILWYSTTNSLYSYTKPKTWRFGNSLFRYKYSTILKSFTFSFLRFFLDAKLRFSSSFKEKMRTEASRVFCRINICDYNNKYFYRPCRKRKLSNGALVAATSTSIYRCTVIFLFPEVEQLFKRM